MNKILARNFEQLLDRARTLYDALCECRITLPDEFYVCFDETDEDTAPIAVMLTDFAHIFGYDIYATRAPFYHDDIEEFLMDFREANGYYYYSSDERIYDVLSAKCNAFATTIAALIK